MQPIPAPSPTLIPSKSCDDDLFPQSSENLSNSNNDTDNPDQSSVNLRRSTRVSKPPVWLDQFVANSAQKICNTTASAITPKFQCFLSTLTQTSNPIYFKEDVKLPQWVQAMNSELDALEMNKTWVVTTLPPGKIAIGC